jgi:hypothetical protein
MIAVAVVAKRQHPGKAENELNITVIIGRWRRRLRLCVVFPRRAATSDNESYVRLATLAGLRGRKHLSR